MTKQHKKKQYYDCQENFKTTKQFSASLQKAVDVKGISKSLIIRTALEMWFDRHMAGWRLK